LALAIVAILAIFAIFPVFAILSFAIFAFTILSFTILALAKFQNMSDFVFRKSKARLKSESFKSLELQRFTA